MANTIKTNKNDFIELEFTGIVKETGQIFDTNVKNQAKKLDLNIDEKKIKPLIICIGQNMVPSAFDKALEEKEINKHYKIELSPEEAFGKRDPSLVKLIPLSAFTEKNIQPQPGMTFALDTTLVKILSVSGGRVLADFNNPLAGKDIIYEFKIKRKITELKEKINALMDFFLKRRFEFETNEKEKKILVQAPKEFEPLINLAKKRFKDILDMDIILKKKKLK